jgi:uncharacterized protein
MNAAAMREWRTEGMNKTICIYHANCADGMAAAWCVNVALGDDVEFVPASYGSAPPDVTGADVIIVDFSYKRDVLMEMSRTARSILVLDHHKTAASDLAGFGIDISTWQRPLGWKRHMLNVYQDACEGIPHASQYVLFDMNRSGAQLAWDFFSGGERPALVDYVADRDLWQWVLPGSREVSAVIASYPMSLDMMADHYARMQADADLEKMIYEGAAILRKHDLDVANGIRLTQRTMVIGGHTVPVANLPYSMASDAAGTMAKDAPFAACYFDGPKGRGFSLRSRGDDGLDVSEIAQKYGGGGHRNAAGFSAPIGWDGDK